MQQKLNEITWATITAKLAGPFILYSRTGTSKGTAQGIQSWEGRLPHEFRCGIFMNLKTLFYNWHHKIIHSTFHSFPQLLLSQSRSPLSTLKTSNLVPTFLWIASLHTNHLPSISIFKILFFSQENLISVSSSDIAQSALPRRLCEHTGVSAWIPLCTCL